MTYQPRWERVQSAVAMPVQGLVDTFEGILCTVGEAPPCTPGDTKCIGPDLYECSPVREWVLVEENSPECIVEEKKFPWGWVVIGAGAVVGAIGLAAIMKKKR